MSFWCSFWNFFCFTVYRKRIDLEAVKSKLIQDMEPPMMCKQLKRYYGKRSIRAQMHSCSSWAPLAVSSAAQEEYTFRRDEEQQAVFQKFKGMLNLPLTMILLLIIPLWLFI